ncbi:WD40-repeat-containing domain protein [Gilbertella persicaria]|uniref:WD repeat-containing protein 4 n=1 Tax=Rhizopus stolonifer TaxID=4846 RepID=A0A367KSI6_RHIST|nr:WD40-repeat-containing domain protein [Gilbertella persicaria]KAI8080124.1 WD40-repeat-containing domain protein [Gilbertella persicaria]RCI05169.1 WD repeat-containing protein 4 [Rhizopus stolonifer]
MTVQLPFTRLAHHPTKPQLVLANGQHYMVLNSQTGELIKSYPKEDTLDSVTDHFRCVAFNKDGSLLATSGENKEICVWDTNDWSLKNTRPAYKRVNALRFDNASTQVVIADKFGDVYCHPIEEIVNEEKLKPIVGHVSMVTDMLLTPDEKYVITSDRDEHIRVSRFPNGYNIESFCLGHTDVVTCIDLIPWKTDVLVSASGDGTVRLWNFVSGECLQVIDLKEHIEAYKPPASDANSEDAIISALSFDSASQTLAVAFAKSLAVLLLNYNQDTFAYKQTLVVSSPVLDITFDVNSQLWLSLDSQEQRITLATLNEEQWAENKENDALKHINTTQVCQANKVFDLYTIFGLRKFLDLPEQNEEETKNKKRKTE